MKQKNRTLQVPLRQSPTALNDFLAARLKISGKAAKRLLDERRVLVNGKRVWMAKHRLTGGQQIDILPGAKPTDKIKVLYRDDDLLVACKPAGILTTGKDSLEGLLRRQLSIPALRAVHRLDRHTSGCLLFTASDKVYAALVEQFRQRAILKIYHVIVAGKWNTTGRRLRSQIDGLDAITSVRVLDSSDDASHLAVRIETGRTHQIRRHLALAEYPVLGDREHGPKRLRNPKMCAVPRQMLHNTVLEFNQPTDGRRVRATAPLPSDFTACLHAFRLT